MSDNPECEEPKRSSFLRDWKFWLGIAGLICTVISTSLAVDKHFGAKAEASARLRAEEEAKAARSQAERAEKRIEELGSEQDSMRKFLLNYSAHLTEIRNAQSRFQETPTPEAEEEIWASIGAFVSFVERWRRVQPILRGLLNGTVEALIEATNRKDKDAARSLSRQLEKGLVDQGALLEKEIENLKRRQR